MKVTTTIEFTDQMIGDLLCSAFEGGSNYWYMIDEFVRPIGDKKYEYRHIEYPLAVGGALIISSKHGDEVNGQKQWRLDRFSIEKGLQTMATMHPKHFADFMEENYDANTGDVFLQCCLFGELIFA